MPSSERTVEAMSAVVECANALVDECATWDGCAIWVVCLGWEATGPFVWVGGVE